MKVNIKGLVFVGFAAVILSANAMAANEDKTVTSKAFTEATYQKKSTGVSVGNGSGTWTALTQSVDSESTHNTAPTAKAVYDAIAASEDATTYNADGTTITLDTTTNTFSATAGSIASGNTGLVNGGQVYTALGDKEDVSNKVTSMDSQSTDAQYPSAKAVYDAIDAATGGNVIPEQDSSICTAQHPCALVNVAGALHWYTMAQDGYAGGELGDAQ